MDLRKIRRAARITQYELAEKTGISRMRLSLAECNYICLTPEEMSAIERATLADVQERLKELSRAQNARCRTSQGHSSALGKGNDNAPGVAIRSEAR